MFLCYFTSYLLRLNGVRLDPWLTLRFSLVYQFVQICANNSVELVSESDHAVSVVVLLDIEHHQMSCKRTAITLWFLLWSLWDHIVV